MWINPITENIQRLYVGLKTELVPETVKMIVAF